MEILKGYIIMTGTKEQENGYALKEDYGAKPSPCLLHTFLY